MCTQKEANNWHIEQTNGLEPSALLLIKHLSYFSLLIRDVLPILKRQNPLIEALYVRVSLVDQKTPTLVLATLRTGHQQKEFLWHQWHSYNLCPQV